MNKINKIISISMSKLLKSIGLALALVTLTVVDLSATHIVGGEMTYRCLGNDDYEITLVLRRDCEFGAEDAQFDNPASFGVFDPASGQNIFELGDLSEFLIPFTSDDTITNFLDSSCGFLGNPVCVHETVYRTTINLPQRSGGYLVAYQRCCRNASLTNVVQPLETGSTYFVEIKSETQQLCNAGPNFKDWTDIYICAGEEYIFDHGATEPDGDRLEYSLCLPASGASRNFPLPQPPNNPPFRSIEYVDGFNVENPLGPDMASIDPTTGILTLNPAFTGQYLLGVCVKEYRGDVLISEVNRDFEVNVRPCIPRFAADFTVEEENCASLNAEFTNASTDGDSYQWFFDYPNDDPAFVSNAASPSFTYPVSGSYNVRLEVFRNEDGCTEVVEKQIIRSDGSSNIELADDGDPNDGINEIVICTGQERNIVLNPDPNVTYSWSPQEGLTFTTANQSNPVASPSETTTYTVTSGIGVCTTENTITVIVSDGETTNDIISITGADVGADGSYQIACAGVTILTASADSELITGYEWSEDASFNTLLSEDAAAAISTAGGARTIYVRAKYSNGCVGNGTAVQVAPSDAGVTNVIGAFPGSCSGDEVVWRFVDNTTYSGGEQPSGYQWTVTVNGEVSTSSDNIFTLALPQMGSATVNLVTTFASGCDGQGSTDVNLNLSESIDFSVGIISCTDDLVNLNLFGNISDLNVNVTDWTWTITNSDGTENTISGQNISTGISLLNSPTIELTATLGNGCVLSIEKSADFEGIIGVAPQVDVAVGDCGTTEATINLSSQIGTLPGGLSIDAVEWILEHDGGVVTASGTSTTVQIPSSSTFIRGTVLYLLSNGCRLPFSISSIDTGIPTLSFNGTQLEGDNEYSITTCGAGISLISNPNPAWTYSWSPEEGLSFTTDNKSNPTANPTSNTTYSVTVSNGDCSTTGTIEVVVIDDQTVSDFMISGVDQDANGTFVVGCGAAATLNVSSTTDDAVVNYEWATDASFNNVISTTNQVNLSGSTATSLFVRAIYAADCISGSKEINISYEGGTGVDNKIIYDINSCEANVTTWIYTDATDYTTIGQPQTRMWSINGNVIDQTGESISVVLPKEGTANVELRTEFAEGCNGSGSKSFDLTLSSFADFRSTGFTCEGNIFEVDLSAINLASSPLLAPILYTWRIDDNGALWNFTGRDINVELSTNAVITLEIGYLNGCTATVTKNFGMTAIGGGDSAISTEIIECSGEEALVRLTGDMVDIDGLSLESIDWTIFTDNGTINQTGNPIDITLTQSIVDIEASFNFSNGCTIPLSITTIDVGLPNVDINDLFVATDGGSAVYSICDGQGISLVDNSNPNWTYTWSTEEGLTFNTSNKSDPIANPTVTTSYTVTVSDGTCSSMETIVVVVADEPGGSLEITGLPLNNDGSFVVGCADDAVLSVSSDNAEIIQNFEWSTDASFDNVISTDGQLNLAGRSETNYFVRAIYSSGCTSTSQEISVSFEDISADDFSITGADINANGEYEFSCDDSPILTATGLDGADVRYEWSTDATFNNIVSDIASIDLSGRQERTYYVRAIAGTRCTTEAKEVNVNFVSSSGDAINISGADTNNEGAYIVGCADNVTLVASSDSDENISNYEWATDASFADVVSTDASLNVSDRSDPIYYVRAVYTSGCISNTKAVSVSYEMVDADDFTITGADVNANGEFEISCADNTMLSATGLDGDDVRFEWATDSSFGNIISSSSTIDLAGRQELIYYVRAVVGTRCISSAKEVRVSFINVGSDEIIITGTNTNNDGAFVFECTQQQILSASVDNANAQFEWSTTAGFENIISTSSEVSLDLEEGLSIVFVRATFSDGCTSEVRQVAVRVNKDVLDVEFIANPVYSCTGAPVRLIANPNPNFTYTWEPEDGLFFEDINDKSDPQANPSTSTSYSVTVTDGECFGTGTVDVVVTEEIFNDFDLDIISCDGDSLTIQLTDLSEDPTPGVNITDWSWKIQYGSVSTTLTEMNPVITVPNDTELDITLVTTSSSGCSASIKVTEFVTGQTAQLVESMVKSCDGDNVTIEFFDATDYGDGESPSTYNWTISYAGTTETSTDSRVELTIPQGQIVTAQLTSDFSQGCSGAGSTTAILDLDVLSDFSIELDQCIEENRAVINVLAQSANLTSDQPPVSYSWVITQNGETTTTTGETLTLDVSLDQNPQLTLVTDYGLGCVGSVTKDLDFEDILGLAPELVVDIVSCDADSAMVRFSNLTVGQIADLEISSLDWTIVADGTTYTASGNPVDITIPKRSTVSANLRFGLEGGCTFDYSTDLTLDLPVPDFNIGEEGSNVIVLCDEQSGISLIANPNPNFTYTWSPETGLTFTTSNKSNPIAAPTTRTTYTVTVDNGICSGTDEVTVTPISETTGDDITVEGTISDCDGNYVVIASGFGAPTPTYEWSSDDSFDNILFTGKEYAGTLASQTEIVYVRANFGESCISAVKEVTIENGNNRKTFNILGDRGICEGNVILAIEDLRGDASVYEWATDAEFTDVFATTQTIEQFGITDEQLTYFVRLMYPDGCQSSVEQIDLVSGVYPELTFVSDPMRVCAGLPVQVILNANDSLTYTVEPPTGVDVTTDPNNPIFTIESSTTYTITANNGTCSTVKSLRFEVGNTTSIGITGSEMSCNGAVDLTAIGPVGVPFEWSNDPDFSEIISTEQNLIEDIDGAQQTYYVRAVTGPDCNSEVASITVINSSVILIPDRDPVTCMGDTTRINFTTSAGAEGMEIQWGSNSRVVEAGKDYIIITSQPGDDVINVPFSLSIGDCDVFDIYQFEVLEKQMLNGGGDPLPDGSTGISQQLMCGEFTMCFESGIDDGGILWDFGDTSIETDTSSLGSLCYTYPGPGTYTVNAVSSQRNCGFDPQQLEVVVPEIIEISATSDPTGVVCAGEEISLTATTNGDPADIRWETSTGDSISSGPSLVIEAGDSADLFAIINDTASGCSDTATVAIEVYDFGIVQDTINGIGGVMNSLICNGETGQILLIESTGDSLSYEWGPAECIVEGGDTATPTVMVTESKDIIGIVTNVETGCQMEIVIPVEASDMMLDVTFSPNDTIFRGMSVDVSATNEGEGVEYTWSNGEQTETITVSPDSSTTYTVQVVDELGCTQSQEARVTVIQPVCDGSDVYLPTAFSPNGDGNNDILRVRSNFFQAFEMYIVDRWGREVFRTNDPDIGWNGQDQNTGEELKSDVYAVCLKVTCTNDVEYIHTVGVTLLR